MINKVYYATASLGYITAKLPSELEVHAITENSILAWELLLEKYQSVYNEPLPLVPATWIYLSESWGLPRDAQSSLTLSSPGLQKVQLMA